jgi:hypothetical protein
MTPRMDIDRRQVLAYRIAAQDLHRRSADPVKLAVLDLGVQDSVRATALLAFVARASGEVTGESLTEDGRLVLAWTHRGAPHYHRRDELAEVVRALVPLDEPDAMARMGWQRRQVEAAGLSASDALCTAARAMRRAVRRTMTKGAASTAVTKLVPPGLSHACRGCQATHILENLMRLASPLGGLRLEAGASPATLTPIEGRPPVRTKPDVEAATAVVARYLRLHGPASKADAAAFVGTTAKAAGAMWPGDLVEVRVDGKLGYLPSDRLDELANPPEPDVVRLLAPLDPFLQSRDRALLVPDGARRKEIWRILGNPGVLLAGGEVAGTWRAKTSGGRLEIAISAFAPLSRATRTAAESEAERVATARGLSLGRVGW